MKNFFELNSSDQLKAIADPLRRRLLEAFAREPQTTKQVAAVIDEKPTKLYHHVDLLEKAGLLKLVETRQNRGTIEKYYQAVAGKFVVRKELVEIGSGTAETENFLIKALEETTANLRESIEKKLVGKNDSEEAIVLMNSQVRLSAEQVGEFSDLIHDWIKENTSAGSGNDSLYQITIVAFPASKK
ncbi:MAG: helix-turn-helix domain-containing protein [Pyrinomonadaceae bacterium]